MTTFGQPLDLPDVVSAIATTDDTSNSGGNRNALHCRAEGIPVKPKGQQPLALPDLPALASAPFVVVPAVGEAADPLPVEQAGSDLLLEPVALEEPPLALPELPEEAPPVFDVPLPAEELPLDDPESPELFPPAEPPVWARALVAMPIVSRPTASSFFILDVSFFSLQKSKQS
jgi:hypothetical protein